MTSWHGDTMTSRPVIAVISGERPLGTLSGQRDRWAALDGRLADLERHRLSPAAMPLVSDDWKQITKFPSVPFGFGEKDGGTPIAQTQLGVPRFRSRRGGGW